MILHEMRRAAARIGDALDEALDEAPDEETRRLGVGDQ